MGHTATLVRFAAATAYSVLRIARASRARVCVLAGLCLAVAIGVWCERAQAGPAGELSNEASDRQPSLARGSPFPIGGALLAVGLLGLAVVRPRPFAEPEPPATLRRQAGRDLGRRFREMIRSRDLDPDLLDEAEFARGADLAAAGDLIAAITDDGFHDDVDELLLAAGDWLAEADSAAEAADLVDRLHRLRRLLHALEASQPATALRAA